MNTVDEIREIFSPQVNAANGDGIFQVYYALLEPEEFSLSIMRIAVKKENTYEHIHEILCVDNGLKYDSLLTEGSLIPMFVKETNDANPSN